MSISIINIIGFMLTAFPCIYFLNCYLKPRYERLKTWIYCLAIIELMIIAAALFIFEEMALKGAIFLLSLYACEIIFYEGSMVRKITAPWLMVAIMLLTEIPFDYVLVYILKLDLTTYMQNAPLLLMIRIIYNALVWYNGYFILKITNHASILKKEPQLYVLMCLQLLIEAVSVSMMQIMGIYKQSFQIRMLTVSILGFAVLVIGVLMLYYLHNLYRRTKLELSMDKMKIEYDKVLAGYLKENDEVYRYLRHDIMNYLIHNELVKEGKHNETNL